MLEIKFEFVFIGDCYAKPFDVHLVVVKALAEDCEMLLAVPLRPCVDSSLRGRQAHTIVSVFQDLDGGCIAVGGVDTLQL